MTQTTCKNSIGELVWTQTLFNELLLPALLNEHQLNYEIVAKVIQLNRESALIVAKHLGKYSESVLRMPLLRIYQSEQLCETSDVKGVLKLQQRQRERLIQCLRAFTVILQGKEMPPERAMTFLTIIEKLKRIVFDAVGTSASPMSLLQANREWVFLTYNIGLHPVMQVCLVRHLQSVEAILLLYLTRNHYADESVLQLLKNIAEFDPQWVRTVRSQHDPKIYPWVMACMLAEADKFNQINFAKLVMRRLIISFDELQQKRYTSQRRFTVREQLILENDILRRQKLIREFNQPEFSPISSPDCEIAAFNGVVLAVIIGLGFMLQRNQNAILGSGICLLVFLNILRFCAKRTPIRLKQSLLQARLQYQVLRLRLMQSAEPLHNTIRQPNDLLHSSLV